MKGYTMSSLDADINPEQEGTAMWGRQPHKPVPRRMWWAGMGGGPGWWVASVGCFLWLSFKCHWRQCDVWKPKRTQRGSTVRSTEEPGLLSDERIRISKAP